MLSGVKFIPRDQVDKEKDERKDVSVKKRKDTGRKRDKSRRKKKTSRSDSSSDDDLDRIKKGSRRNKKWYSSDECSPDDSSDSEGGSESGSDGKSNRYRGKKKRRGQVSSRGKDSYDKAKKMSQRSSKDYSSDEYSSSSLDYDDRNGSMTGSRKRWGEKKYVCDDLNDDSGKSHSVNKIEIARKEMGLDWMLRPAEKGPAVSVNQESEEPPAEEMKRTNPRELNPYLKDNGSGYPDDADEKKVGGDQLHSSSLVGDGGASWRLKAFKRAQEQAAREGRKFDEVVEERWGSFGQLALSAASHRAAPSRAHLHAIKNRKKGPNEEEEPMTNDQSGREKEKNADRRYLKNASIHHPEMRAPKVHGSLSWGKQKNQNRSAKDATLVSTAASSLNKFANDGSFMSQLQNMDVGGSVGSYFNQGGKEDSTVASPEMNKCNEYSSVVKDACSANQLAAKALQLRMKGKHEEAEKLMQEVENIKTMQSSMENIKKPQIDSSMSRYAVQDVFAKRKEGEDGDRHLAQKIIQNKKYSFSGRADDEYDFEDGPSRKSRKKGRDNDSKVSGKNDLVKRILTQQERCLFCFENPNRPKHLVVSIANFTYLMLPQWQPVVPGHCCILPMQHDSATRSVDNNVWEEIRNFKKCLITMFSRQEKEVVFLETVLRLSQQRRHCLIECIPLPCEIAKQAPLYFKKAIDEAEDEWSQHNAKKLIDTSEKGLRSSIPKDFPYFHVEFGLDRGFVHVIDDESSFKSSLGLDIIRGMLHLPAEDMHRRRRHESVEAQKQRVANFVREWEPYDWTKQLD